MNNFLKIVSVYVGAKLKSMIILDMLCVFTLYQMFINCTTI